MRSVHILGLGFVVGMVAVGTMVSAAAYRWQESAYPPEGAAAAGGPRVPVSVVTNEVAQGQAIFLRKCASCHSIGGGDKLGPDLKGVADRREHDWLVEFIVAPDQMIARNDPIALELLEQYGVPMPNVGVTPAQAEDVLAYIQSR